MSPIFYYKNRTLKLEGGKKVWQSILLISGSFQFRLWAKIQANSYFIPTSASLIIMPAASCVDSLASSTCFYCAVEEKKFSLFYARTRVFSIRNNVRPSDFCHSDACE